MPQAQATITEEAVYIDPSLILKSTPLPTIPPIEPIQPPPAADFLAPKADTLIFNIETLGIKPWESRIITIGFQDVKSPEIAPSILMMDDEKAMIQSFLSFFKENGYKNIVCYNGSFDYRYIIARAMYYGLPCSEFHRAEVLDLMRAMKYGRMSYLWGDQPAGSLDNWG
ncbi:MAG: ribonuclease H-like domain-containing protein, partial [Deltaproteobacteria bacterium]|nr:ribonuclease H-like domain-containing protein [Deltaproteobacteria bacterium]